MGKEQNRKEILQITASMSDVLKMGEVAVKIIKDSQQEVYKLIAAILDVRKAGKKVVGIAEGRSALALWSFLMRLVHININAYVSGQVGLTTPSIKEGDLIIVVSGSGATDTNVARCETLKKAKIPGVKIILITYDPKSILARKYADTIICLPEKSAIIKRRKQLDRNYIRSQLVEAAPLGSLFETITVIFLDAVIVRLMKITGVTEGMMEDSHIRDKAQTKHKRRK